MATLSSVLVGLAPASSTARTAPGPLAAGRDIPAAAAASLSNIGSATRFDRPLVASAAEQPVKAGVGVVDLTWHVGAASGSRASSVDENPDEFVHPHGTDPDVHSVRNFPSYGIQSRNSARALLIEGADGTRVAFLKNDLYIPQDLLNQRVAQILQEHDTRATLLNEPTTGIRHDNLVISVSHNHSSPYYSTPSWGVWAFADVFDIRNFEYTARRMADAVIEAAGNLVPVRMGAATVYYDATQKHSFGSAVADDGTPAGYPQTDNDHSYSVVRFDDISDPSRPEPLANYVTVGQHPEFLEPNDLITGEWIAPMERMTDNATGAVTIMAQNNTGTVESDSTCLTHPCAERAEFDHREYAQAERGARRMSDTILAGWRAIARGEATRPEALIPVLGNAGPEKIQVVPFSSDFPVKYNDKQFAPPYSHPYPSVSNCRTHEAVEGNPGVPIAGLPDCEREGFAKPVVEQIPEPFNPGATYERLKEAGIPIPENYPGPSYAALQETFQVHLQAVRLGEVLITVCPCEQWADQSRNIKTRADKVQGNMWLGYPRYEECDQVNPPDGTFDRDTHEGDPDVVPANPTWSCQDPRFPQDESKRLEVTDYRYHRMKAQITNDANGWDEGWERCHDNTSSGPVPVNDGTCPLAAESEPVDTDLIKGNFTQTPFMPAEWLGDPFPAELPPELGYDLVLPVGMANDYWGYIASYREYQRGDHYRKALTGLGAHSSDFLATRLVTMGGHLKDGPDYPYNALDIAYRVDGVHQEIRAAVIGNDAAVYVSAYEKQHPTDGGLPHVLEQPEDIQRFDVSQFSWVGGSNFFDDPFVRVQRLDGETWVDAYDMSGEVPVTLEFPDTPEELAAWRAGTYEWKWTAHFEAFDSDIDTGRRGFRKCPGSYPMPPNWEPRCSQVPAGTYRFVVDGAYRTLPADADGPSSTDTKAYRIDSEPFEVDRWEGITVPDFRLEDDGTISFTVGPVNEKEFCPGYFRCGDSESRPKKTLSAGPIDYPDSWPASKRPIAPKTGLRDFPRLERTYVDPDVNGRTSWPDDPSKNYLYCFPCTFRPWIDTGEVDTAMVRILRADGTITEVPATFSDGRWRTTARIYEGDEARIERAGIVDTFGEINGEPSAVVVGALSRPSSGLSFTPRSARSGQYTDRAFIEARLVDADDAPVSGARLTFRLSRNGQLEKTWSERTDVSGLAGRSIRLDRRPAGYELSVAFEGTPELAGAGAAEGFTVIREDTHTRLTVPRRRVFRARLSDLDTPTSGVGGRRVSFFVGGDLVGRSTTDARGVARIRVDRSVNLKKSFVARFTGDRLFRPSAGFQRPPLVRLRVSDGTPRRGQRIRFTATLRACERYGDRRILAGTRVLLLKKVGGRFEAIGSERLDNRCRASFTRRARFKRETFQARWPKQLEDYRDGGSRYRTLVTH